MEENYKMLSEATTDLFVPRVICSTMHTPTAIEFLRNHISPNVPLLIKGGARHWPAYTKWTPDYLIDKLNNKRVTVAVTPNGYADNIASTVEDGKPKRYFVTPEERSIPIGDLFSKLQGKHSYTDDAVKKSTGIFYLQKQDSNLMKEFPELIPDIETSISWVDEALESEPTAINLWIGDSRSVTSLHKDPFENIYCVVSGYKDFILLPPTDCLWLKHHHLQAAQYKEVHPGQFVIEPTPEDSFEGKTMNSVPWIPLDPLKEHLPESDYVKYGHPLHVRVDAGDLLYLPSLWFHHVSQSDDCIAVNFWYDMAIDIKFVYFKFLEHLRFDSDYIPSRDDGNNKDCNENLDMQ